MFPTNPPEFDAVPDTTALGPKTNGDAEGPEAGKNNCSIHKPEFATLEAFAEWIDDQLNQLEADNESFETVSSVRGFYGR